MGDIVLFNGVSDDELCSAFDNIPDTMKFTRTESFYKTARILSDFIRELPLTAADNDKLVAMMVEQVKEAERAAFVLGYGTAAGMKLFEEKTNERTY